MRGPCDRLALVAIVHDLMLLYSVPLVDMSWISGSTHQCQRISAWSRYPRSDVMPHLHKTRRHVRTSWNDYIVIDVALDVVEPECTLVVWHRSACRYARDSINETEVKVARASTGACLALYAPSVH